MTAKDYVAAYGVPPSSALEFRHEVVLTVHNLANERCMECGKRKRRDNLKVVPIHVPDPTDKRYQPMRQVRNFQRLDNATLLCRECEDQLRSGIGDIGARLAHRAAEAAQMYGVRS